MKLDKITYLQTCNIIMCGFSDVGFYDGRAMIRRKEGEVVSLNTGRPYKCTCNCMRDNRWSTGLSVAENPYFGADRTWGVSPVYAGYAATFLQDFRG